MPIYRITAPNGRTYEIEGPPGATQEQVAQAVLAQDPSAGDPAPSPRRSLTNELGRGFEQLVSSSVAGVQGTFDPNRAATESLERQQGIAERRGEGPSLAGLKDVYQREGLGAAARRVAGDVPLMLAQQAPNLAAMGAGAKLGAMGGTAVAGPAGTIPGAVLGGATAILPSFFGQNISAQAQEQLEQGQAVDVHRGKAGAAAVGQAAVEATGTAFILGKRLLGSLVGNAASREAAAKALATQAQARLAGQGVARTAAAGAARGLVEMPVEVAQTVIERLQAGQDLLSEDAQRDYGEALYGAALIGPALGGAGRLSDRNAAQRAVDTTEREREREERLQNTQALQAQAAQEQARRESPEYLLELDARYRAFQQELTRMQADVAAMPAPKDDPSAVAAKKAAGEAVSAFRRDNADLVKEHAASRGLIAQAQRSPEDVFLEQTLAGAREGRGRPAQGLYPQGVVEPAPTEGAELQAYAQQQLEAAAYFEPNATAETRVQYLMHDPVRAQQMVRQNTRIPGLSASESKLLLGSLRKELSALAGQMESGRIASIEARDAATQTLEQQQQAQRQREQDELLQWAENAVAQEQAVGREIEGVQQAAAGVRDMRMQPRLFPEQAEASAPMAPASRSAPQLRADIQIARATGNRQALQDAVEALRALPRERRPDDATPAPDRSLEAAAGMRVPEAQQARLDAQADRDVAYADVVRLLDRFNRGAAKREQLTAARDRFTENALKEAALRKGAPLTPPEQQNLVSQIKHRLSELRMRFGDTRDEVNIGTRKEPDMQPVQWGSGRFREDLPAEGEGPTGMGLANVEGAQEGFRTFGSRFDAAQTIREELEQLVRGFGPAQEGAPGVDRTRARPLAQAVEQALPRATPEDAQRLQELQRIVELSSAASPTRAPAAQLLQDFAYRTANGLPTATHQRDAGRIIADFRAGARNEQGQMDLPGTQDAVQGQIFDSYEAFADFLASDALAQQRRDTAAAEAAAKGLPAPQAVADTAERLFRRMAPLRAKFARMQAELQRAIAQRDMAQDARERGLASTQRLIDAAQADLKAVQDEIERQLGGYEIRYFEADQRLSAAARNAADIAQQIADNVAAMEGSFAAQEATRAPARELQRALQEVATAKGRWADLIEAPVKGETIKDAYDTMRAAQQRAVAAHGRLIQARRAAPDARQADRQIQQFLRQDIVLQAKLAAANREVGASKGQLTKARKAITAAREALAPMLEPAQASLEVARQIKDMVDRGNQQQLDQMQSALRAAIDTIIPIQDRLLALERGIASRAEAAAQERTVPSPLATKPDTAAERAAEQQRLQKQAQEPRTRISYEGRRRWNEELEKAPVRVAKLEEFLANPELPADLREQYQAELDRRRETTARRVEARTREEGADARTIADLDAQIAQVRSELSGELLNQKELARVAKNPELRAELEAPKRAKREAKLTALRNRLAVAQERAERRGGMQRMPINQGEAAEAPTRRTPVAPNVFERYAETQRSKRATTPATRDARRPGRVFEGTKPVTRNTPVSGKEQKEANKVAGGSTTAKLTRLTDVENAIERLDTEIIPRLTARAATEPRPGDQDKLKEANARIKRLRTEAGALRKELGNKAPPKDAPDALRRVDRDGTPMAQIAERGAQAGDARRMVDAIGQSTDDPFTKRVARALMPFMGNTRISVVDQLPGDTPDAPGGASADGTRVWLNRNNGLTEETALHEATHAATMQQLSKPEGKLTREQLAAKRELEAIHAAVRADDSIDNVVAKDPDLKEFVAEALGSKKLQQALAQKQAQQNMWQRFKSAVMRLLGMDVPAPANQRDRVLELAQKFMQAPEAKGQSVAPTALRAKTDAPATPIEQLANEITAKPRGFLDKVRDMMDPLAAEMWGVDMRAPTIKALQNISEDGFMQAQYFIRKADARMAQTYAVLDNGPLHMTKDKAGLYQIRSGNGPSAVQVFEAIGRIPVRGEAQQFAVAQTYMVAQRAKRVGWDKLNFDNVADLKAAAQRMEEQVKADPALRDALNAVRRLYNEYNQGLVNFLAESGAISKAEAQRLTAGGDYVPFYRVQPNGLAELVMGEGTPLVVGDIKRQQHLKALKGDNQKLLPLNEAIMRNTMLLTDMGLRNLATKSTAYGLQELGKAAKVNRIQKGQGPAGDDIIRFRQEPDPRDKEDTGERWVRVQTEGTAAEGVPADLLVQSLEGSHVVLPSFLKAAGWFGDLLRAGVTRNPAYVARQLMRDPAAASFVSGTTRGPVRAMLETVREYGRMYTKPSESSQELLKRGVVQSGVFSGDPDDLAKFALQLSKGNQSAIRRLLAGADKAAMRADSATRVQVYDDTLATTGSEVQAELAAMEMMNFTKRGASPTVQYASRLIPFFNAQIQGLNVLYKAARGKMPLQERMRIKEQFYRRAVFMAGLTMLYAAAMEDDEAYKNARPRERYSNFFVPMPGGETMRIPIPFELGFLFKAIPEAAMDAMRGELNEKEWDALRGLMVDAIPGGMNYGIPQIAKPAIELATNHSFFTDRPIESAAMRAVDPQERYGINTTELAKRLSSMSGGVLSPIQLEYLVRGYLGGIPIAIASLTNELFATDDASTRPARRLGQTPLVGSLFQDEDALGAVDTAYAKAQAIEQAGRTLDKLGKEGRIADAQRYIDTYSNVLAAEPMARKFKQHMSRLRDADAAVRQSSMSPEQKRDELRRLDQLRNQLARTFTEALARVRP
jgi:hypothetical protein